jgi:hypothetical protein
LKMVWFENELPGGENPEKFKTQVKAYSRENEEEIHELLHFAGESEIELVKILNGSQEMDSEGRVTLRTVELHFMKDLILIERVVEVQEPGSYDTRSTSTQLGYLDLPCCADDCCTPTPQRK